MGLADPSTASGTELDLDQICWCASETQCISLACLELWSHKGLPSWEWRGSKEIYERVYSEEKKHSKKLEKWEA